MELLILTPEKNVIEETVDEVVLPAKAGEMGVLPGHTHLISELDIGVVVYTEAGYDKKRAVFVAGGVVEIKDDVVKILTPAGEKGEDIDLEQAEEELKRVESTFENQEVIEDERKFAQLEVALKRALAKVQAAKCCKI